MMLKKIRRWLVFKFGIKYGDICYYKNGDHGFEYYYKLFKWIEYDE